MDIKRTETKESFDPTIWVDRHGDYLYAIALSRLRDAASAESVLQKALLSAVKSFDSQERKMTERAWLAEILHTEIRDFYRSKFPPDHPIGEEIDHSSYQYLFGDEKWRDHWTEETTPVEWCETPEKALGKPRFCAILEHCLKELPERIADAFMLHKLEGLERAEICDILRLSDDNYCAMLHRARTHLRRCLEYDWFRKNAV